MASQSDSCLSAPPTPSVGIPKRLACASLNIAASKLAAVFKRFPHITIKTNGIAYFFYCCDISEFLEEMGTIRAYTRFLYNCYLSLVSFKVDDGTLRGSLEDVLQYLNTVENVTGDWNHNLTVLP